MSRTVLISKLDQNGRRYDSPTCFTYGDWSEAQYGISLWWPMLEKTAREYGYDEFLLEDEDGVIVTAFDHRAEFFVTAAHTNGNRYKLFYISVVAD